jgi:hypothetical protein
VKYLIGIFIFILITLINASTLNAALVGDVNLDGKVDIVDIGIVIDNYGASPISNPKADLNSDGRVNIIDIGICIDGYGNSPIATSTPTNSPPPGSSAGVWISQQEIMNLPVSGAAWDQVAAWAAKPIGTPTLNNQDSDQDGIALAKAYTCARVGQHCADLIAALNSLSSHAPGGDRSLAWGRNLPMWIISADVLINSGKSAGLNVTQFKTWANTAINTNSSEAGSIIQCHEGRSNNWSTMCGAARMAVHSFLNDRTALNRAWDVYRGYMGDRSPGAYTGFSGGQQCTNWRCPGDCDKVWLNPKGCTKAGRNFDGALPHEMQRQGEWDGNTWPPPFGTTYPWNGLAGIVVQAEIMFRKSFPAYSVADSAVLRAYSWDVDEAKKSVTSASEASWMPWVINKRYGRSYPVAPLSGDPGQNAAFLEWTHAR